MFKKLTLQGTDHLAGYGQTGPYAKAPGYDVISQSGAADCVLPLDLTRLCYLTVEAEAGLMHITGEPDGKPVKVGVAITGASFRLCKTS